MINVSKNRKKLMKHLNICSLKMGKIYFYNLSNELTFRIYRGAFYSKLSYILTQIFKFLVR